MVVQSGEAAVENAKASKTCDVGYCLKYTRTWLGIPSREYDAITAWENAQHKHVDGKDKDAQQPPKGAPVFWRGGSHGHIALATNNDHGRSTDTTSGGVVGTQEGDWWRNNWGMDYLGWTEDLNAVDIPYLRGGGESEWASGDVYVAKLEQGKQDSDSVARLCYRLRTHPDMPGSHKPPQQSRNYGPEIVEAVRYWQRNIYPKSEGGIDDGTSVGNKQANRLFGDAYKVIEE